MSMNSNVKTMIQPPGKLTLTTQFDIFSLHENTIHHLYKIFKNIHALPCN